MASATLAWLINRPETARATNPPAAPTPLTFTDNNQGDAQSFYRVVVDP